MGKPVVAFVCTHNACRSQIAEAMARRFAVLCHARPLRGNAPGEDRQSRCRTSTGKRIRIRRCLPRAQIPDLPTRCRHPHHHGVRR